ncbi:MAG TPA: hypothetical protein VKW08_14110 [Xanthobacteraceae bacterium]|jgi:hypothetical protein|nr:hypothetical protein [Xanthobacteraceae bacterium]
MKRQVLFLSAFTVAILTLPAFADDGAPGILGFRWGKNVFNFEGMPSGPQPLRNLSRLRNGKANNGRLVGDYHNPILTPEAAAIVKAKGELAIAGKGFANAQDQCHVMGPPFALAMGLTFAMLPTAGANITILYDGNMNVRRVRMNSTHPAKLQASPTGDSVGHWEGDTLVIDTIGVRVDDLTTVDRFGTPQSEAMHVIERYHLIDNAVAKAQMDKFETTEGTVGGGERVAGYSPDTSLKGLQLEIMIEDPKVFVTPLTARVTYRRVISEWQEAVCAENPVDHYPGEWAWLPKADRPDF